MSTHDFPIELNITPELLEKIRKIKLIGLDADGVLTDGGAYLADGVDMRRFDTRDGVGVKMLQKSGIVVAIVSGKVSAAVERRAAELGIEDLIQGKIKKLPAMDALVEKYGVTREETAFVGDDLLDVPAFRRYGLGVAPSDACDEALEEADLNLTKPGGKGAIRQLSEIILKARGDWAKVLEELYDLKV